MTATDLTPWRDGQRIPKGMNDFARWFRPPVANKRIGLSDADGLLHTLNGNRFILWEFKPEFAEGDPDTLTNAQRITLEGFSKLPGCTGLVIYDPYWDDVSRTAYRDDQMVNLALFKGGTRQNYKTSIGKLNILIAKWFDGEGPLHSE